MKATLVLLAFATLLYAFNTSVSKQSVLGKSAPEIVLLNPEGKSIKLSSLRGKYVLLDFWASWCGPCRRENPNLVSTYAAYKTKKFIVAPGAKKTAKGFEIYQVSIDENSAQWKAAIQKDGLNWPTHVVDPAGWHSAVARLYSVNSIPSNFLIDPKGVIVASNLRGSALKEKLDLLLAK